MYKQKTVKAGTLDVEYDVFSDGDEELLRNLERGVSDKNLSNLPVERGQLEKSVHRLLLGSLFSGEFTFFGIIASIKPNGWEQAIGIGHYFGRTGCYPKVSYIVADQYQGRGIGTQIVSELINHAKENEIEGFIANIKKGNNGSKVFLNKYAERIGMDILERGGKDGIDWFNVFFNKKNNQTY